MSKSFRNRAPILLDGGLSNQLEAQGCDLDNPLWSALLLKDNPDALVQAHRHYLDAGADCIISASYQASRAGFAKLGLNATQADELIASSVTLAKQTVSEYMADNPTHLPQQLHKPLVAASIGPYGATLADGSEYHGRYQINGKQLALFHQQRLTVLDNAEADILGCETIPSYREARVLQQLLLNVSTPTWLSLACQDGQHINDGTPIEQVVALFTHHPKVFAIGINCTALQHVEALIGRIKAVCGDKMIIAYPNSGEQFNPNDKTWHGHCDETSIVEASQRWLAAGADIIGGCCRIGPKHIRAIKRKLASISSI